MSRATVFFAALAFGCALAKKEAGAQLRGTAEDKFQLNSASKEQNDYRSVTQVVRMLEDMLKRTKQEGEDERKLFAKHKCYCDQNEAEKTAEIAALAQEIESLACEIDEILGKNALLSRRAAEIKAAMEENREQLLNATAIRNSENQTYGNLYLDHTDAINTLQQAITILSGIGADQAAAAQGHTQYMAEQGYAQAGYSPEGGFVQLQGLLRQAAMAAQALGKDGHAQKLSALEQASSKGRAPFTATYSTQSGEIYGILADMRDTFERELEEATKKEIAAQKAYDALKIVLDNEHGVLGDEEIDVQGDLSGHDTSLQTKRDRKGNAEIEKSDAESFLATLRGLCTEKAAQYEKRVALRAKEEAALAQAISILNSDLAFEAFGKVAATKTGPTSAVPNPSFVQLKRRGNLKVDSAMQRRKADALLREAVQKSHSLKAARIAFMLESQNPFSEVLEAIEQMLKVIKEEEAMDVERDQWCQDERAEKGLAKTKAEDEIDALKLRIGELEFDISGLKTDIKNTEDALLINRESQISETAARKEENLDYQKNIENLVTAQDLLKKAIVVLKAYYEDALAAGAAGTGLLQVPTSPAPPPTWTGEYAGQSSNGGTDAVAMLEFILTNTKAEETTAHSDEQSAQSSYETSMRGLKNSEATLQDTLASKKEDLAAAEEELLGKRKDKKAMEGLLAEIEAYLLKIKPGCDFLQNNLFFRSQSRGQEAAALRSARTAIQGTPAYQEAVMVAHNETLGDCKDTCAIDEDHVDCKACVAQVSVPGYCAGHPGTAGCA